ncbi:MAG: hypothetical protein JO216_11850 [Hyphomicrobiales bacterium]|nr:hypothetical protein [Hyphomicrobiales bacterium]
MRDRILGIAFAAIFVFTTGHANAHDEDAKTAQAKARLLRETRALFQVMRDGQPQPQACEFNKVWESEPVRSDLAQAIPDLKVHSRFMPRTYDIVPQSILDPNNETPEAFCDWEESKSNWEKRIASFEKSEEKTLAIRRSLYSFPIFTHQFTKAAIYVGHSTDTRYNGRGRIKGEPLFLFEGIEVFEKSKGTWRHLKTITLGIT